MKRNISLGLAAVATTIILLFAWKKDPAFTNIPGPGKIVWITFFIFFMISVLIFTANLLLALARGKNAKTEEDLESIVAPAMQAQEYDNRIITWTEIPRLIALGIFVGALGAAGLHQLIK
jgi:heme/copper-type cytochrome/quinol oxidase subunit 2